MKNLLFFIAAFLVVSCNSKPKSTSEKSENNSAGPTLELLWQSDTTLRTPESVLIDKNAGILYVSCINEKPWEKDGNGFISKMDLQGNVSQLNWVNGLSAPKGMGLRGDQLFVADIEELVQIDTKTATIVARFKVEGEPQLNDVCVGDDANVYVSASGTSIVYLLNDGALQPLFQGAADERFNGLFWEKDRMLLVTSGSSQLQEIPWLTMEARVLADNLGAGDGLCAVGNGCYIATSWRGNVFFVDEKGKVTVLLDTEEAGENTADAAFDTETQILYIPTFYKNRVKAFKLVR